MSVMQGTDTRPHFEVSSKQSVTSKFLKYLTCFHCKTVLFQDACKSYISEHPELTSTEVFQDLPEHLQMEVETLT